jgi:DNA-binding GntR family transcriptional regulator
LMKETKPFIDYEGLIVEHEQLLELILAGRKEELDQCIENHILWDNSLLLARSQRRIDGAAHSDVPHVLAAKPP